VIRRALFQDLVENRSSQNALTQYLPSRSTAKLGPTLTTTSKTMLHPLMYEPLQLALRVLQDDENATNTTNTTNTPSTEDAQTLPPSAAPTSDDAAQSFGFFFFTIVVVVGGFICWRCFVLWRNKRERRMNALQSARADTVLGDMQVGYFPSSSSSRLRAYLKCIGISPLSPFSFLDGTK
jgi:hypothetical protein